MITLLGSLAQGVDRASEGLGSLVLIDEVAHEVTRALRRFGCAMLNAMPRPTRSFVGYWATSRLLKRTRGRPQYDREPDVVPVSISSCAGPCVWHVVGLQRSVAGVGDPRGLGRAASTAGAGARNPDRSARDAGGLSPTAMEPGIRTGCGLLVPSPDLHQTENCSSVAARRPFEHMCWVSTDWR